MPTPPPNQQSDDDEDDAVEHGAAISVTIPPMTKIAAMIHRIVATPPTVPRWNRKQIHVALTSDGADRPLPAEPQCASV